VHDAVAVAALIRPDIMTMEDMYVAVETTGDYCRGATVGDRLGVLHRPANARVIMGIDREAFVDLLVEAATCYNKGGERA
jgi:pyrimidine-specific ribonucleoside hydrolase